MLYYSTLDEAWGAPITYETKRSSTTQSVLDSSPVPSTLSSTPIPAKRSDADVCRDHLVSVYASQGPAGLRRLLGPHMTAALHEKKSVSNVLGGVFGTFGVDADDVMVFGFACLVIYLLQRG